MATAMKDIATNLQNFAEVVSLAVLPKWCGYEGAENTNNSNNTSEMKIGKLSQLVEADILNRTYYEQKMTNCCNPRIVAAMATLLHRYTQLDTIGITCEVASKNEKRSNSFKAVTVSFSNEVSFQEICSQVTDQLSKTTADTFDNRLLQSLLKNNFIGNEIIKSLFRFVASNDLSFNNLMHPNEFLLQLGSTDETKIGKTEKLLIYYDSMLYSEDQARQILTNISTILLNGFSNSIQPVQKMCILSEAKRQKILFEFNNINTNSLDDINTTGGLVQVFLQNIPKRPYKLAVVEDHGSHVTSLTYSMLHKRALAAASILHKNRFQLSKKDTPAEALIAVLLPQGINCITACLSCLILDKSVASIHYAFSPNDIKNSLSDIGNPFLITDKKKWESMEISYDDVFLLDNYNEDISIMAKSFTSQMLKTSLKSNTASFCYFTSGSTGTPKPVHMTVKGMLNIVKCVAAHYVNGENTKSMLVAPSGRSLSYLELWGSFYVGATVYIPPEDVRTDMDKLRRWLYYYDITNLSLSASIAETLVSCTPEKQIYLSKLNWILMGGEKCHKMDLRSRHYKFTCTLIYGTSESSPVTEYTMNSGKIHVNPPAGSSIKNASVYVLDKWLNPVPIGVKGN